MPQAVDVRTPIATGEATKVGKRLWRKQVLPNAKLNVRGRVIEFTPDYFRKVEQAFRDEAYPTVPFMLADKNNDHTMDPERAHGEVLSLEAADDGLYATLRLSEVAERIVRDNPRFGVSVRIREDWDRADGKHYPAAMQHLLGTFDGVAPGMKPWEPIDLSTPADDVVVIDLSAATYDDTSTPTSGGEPTMADLTADELATLRAALPLLQRLQDDPGDDAPAGETRDGDTMTEADFEALAADIFGDLDDDGEDGGDWVDTDDAEPGDNEDGDADEEEPAEQPELAGVAASNTGGDVVELSNSARDEDRRTILELSQRLDAANYEKERDALVRATGLPPSIIDLARPVLEGSRHVVELSNGTSVDAGDVVRQILKAVGEKVQMLDLSASLGTDEPTDEDKAAAEHRASVADRILANF